MTEGLPLDGATGTKLWEFETGDGALPIGLMERLRWVE